MQAKMFKRIVALLLTTIMIFSVTSCDMLNNVLNNFLGDNTDPGNPGNKEEPKDETPYEPVVDPISDDNRTFYQIFVGSFADSNNDTIGDLRGIIENIDYLNDGDINSGKSLGVQGIWLSPIFSSPSYHKYDAKDYYQIDWRFGMEKDLVELVELCHERNVKVILDLAINHTSNQHEWFLKFKEARLAGDKSNKYYNYYSCTTEAGKKAGVQYQKIAGVDCYYECNFTGDMPELNFDNSEVKQEMLNVAKYYLDLGVDGFRFDAIKYIYYNDTARSVAFWDWYMTKLREYKPDVYAVGECWSGDSEVEKYYSSMNCFNFTMASTSGTYANTAKGINSVLNFANYFESYQNRIQSKRSDAMVMSFLSNHDQDRIAGTFVNDNYAKMVANLYLLTSGSPVIYYGEEIGMRGSRGTEATDANRRLAMIWGNSYTPWNPTGATYADKNQIKDSVVDQMADENSMYNHYCRLLAIRHKYEAIARGHYMAINCGNSKLGGFLVEYKGEYLVIIHNTSTTDMTYDLSRCSALTGKSIDELCDYIGAGKASLNGNLLIISAQTSVILK